jgi:LysR family glycine cleavage system transcriptional activator
MKKTNASASCSPPLPPLNWVRVFAAAARHLSFKKAAEELHVTPAAVSHQIKALELYLGVKLFRRLARALELTEEARAALPGITQGLEHLAAAFEHCCSESATLTVIVPPSFATRWLVPRLQLFNAIHPMLDLRIMASVEAIDRPGQHFSSGGAAGPGQRRADLEIRFGTGSYPGYRTEKLLSVSYIPVCSPRLLEGDKPLRAPADLEYHTLLHDDTVTDLRGRPTWDEWLRLEGVEGVNCSRGPHFNNSTLVLEAAVDGAGIALGMHPLIAGDLLAGRLVVPFGESMASHFAYFLVSPDERADRPNVIKLRKWLLEEMANDQQPEQRAP